MSGTQGPSSPDERPDAASGWQRPGDPPQPPRSDPPGPGSTTGWGNVSGPAAWQIPDVKPGVVPLRPLAVGEILDGAVTTIRRNLGAMLGLSAAVAAGTQLLATGSTLWVFGDRVVEPDLGLTQDVEQLDGLEQLEDLAIRVPAALLGSFVGLIATVFLTGVLTVVVGQAVLGRHLTITQAWQESKSRLLRLLGLTFVYTAIWLSPFIILVVLAVLAAFVGTGLLALTLLVGLVAAALAGIWLYVRYALSLPSLMLEAYTGTDGVSRPVRIVGSLRRSAVLVRRSWWRVFAILLLIAFIAWLIGQVVAVPFGLPGLFGLFGGSNFGGSTLTWLILNTLAGMIGATITAPFTAAATALLYVDQRIRREGLDIELARVAGVELPRSPGSDVPPPGGP